MARPQTYDPDAVIDRALRLFWAEGFHRCDVETLTARADVNRHSLYKAFGGKKGLFETALERYIDTVAAGFLAGLDAGPGLDGILAYFRKTVEILGEGSGPSGCFVTNSVVELGRTEPQVNALVARHYARIEEGFVRTIERGRADGSIRIDVDAAATARWLVVTSQGLSVSARFGGTDPGILPAIRKALAAS